MDTSSACSSLVAYGPRSVASRMDDDDDSDTSVESDQEESQFNDSMEYLFPAMRINFPDGVIAIMEKSLVIDTSDDEDDDEEFANSEAWKALKEIVDKEIRLVSKRPVRRHKKDVYDGIIKVLGARADSCGFTNVELLIIWEVASNPRCHLTCALRKQMILAMTPKMLVGEEVILSIINWLEKASSGGNKPSVVIATYQLLNLYMDYFLMENSDVVHAKIVTKVLYAPTDNFAIPWKMRFFRSIIRPKTLTPQHIKELEKLGKNMNLKNTQQHSILMTLDFCKRMLYGKDGPPMPNLNAAPLHYFPDVRNRYYGSLLRVQNGKIPDPGNSTSVVTFTHPMKHKIFPEFLPEKLTQGDENRRILEEVFVHLETNEGINKMCQNPSMMLNFERWLKLVTYHKLHNMGCFETADVMRYAYLFEKCVKLSEAQNSGIAVINEWLPKFHMLWDMSLFQQAVIALIPYLEPKDIWENRHQLENKITKGFSMIIDQKCKLFVWKAFTGMFWIWWKRLKQTVQDSPEFKSYCEGMNWLLTFLAMLPNALLTSMSYDASELIYEFIAFYKELLSLVPETPNEPRDSWGRLKMLFASVPVQLRTLGNICRHPQVTEVLAGLILAQEEGFVKLKTEFMDLDETTADEGSSSSLNHLRMNEVD